MNIREPIPFAAVTDTIAKTLVRVLHAQMAHCNVSQMAVKIKGAWHKRRFTISSITENDFYVTAPIRDIENKCLIVPVVNDPDFYANVLRGFGMAVQAAARKADQRVELAVADDIGHLVPGWHHVAACGFKGPWAADGTVAREMCRTCSPRAACR